MSDSDGNYAHSSSDDADGRVAAGGSGYGTRSHGGKSKHGNNAQGSDRRRRGKERGRERWEGNIQDRDSGAVKEGEDGRITADLGRLLEARKRKRSSGSLLTYNLEIRDSAAARQLQRLRQDTQPFQRGIIRHLIFILDLSEAMNDKDMRPNRFVVTLKYAQEYVREFFEQNPISQLSVLAMHDGLCIKVSELSGNPNDHITAINELRFPRTGLAKEPKGSPSLQNALEMSRATLYHTPRHGTREVIIILGALLTLDPGDIYTTIGSCVKDRIRVNIIGMSGRMKICQEICSRTNAGDDSTYGVALDQTHFRELLLATTTPPVIRAAQSAAEESYRKATLLMMGFPSRIEEDHATLCACHGTATKGGYTCSRCRAKVCNLPATCPSCGMTLILSTHLARSYHHLFPLKNWLEVSWTRAREIGSTNCKGCLSQFPHIPVNIDNEATQNGRQATTNGNAVQRPKDPATEGASESGRYECPSCANHFCIDCDLFCHEVLHNCPGCLSSGPLGTEDGMAVDVVNGG